MIFIANVLELNGGTTFLVRTCEALRAAGRDCAVLVLRRGGDAPLAEALAKHARIIHLGDYQRDASLVFRNQTSAFGPVAWVKLASALAPFGSTVHAMGGFGLIVAARMAHHVRGLKVTMGIYHQNEFIYRPHRFFSAPLMALFRRLPAENLLFFNEVSRENYARFHSQPDYRYSAIAPIGIRVTGSASAHARRGNRIVSVGNLESFKTYNKLVIGLLPSLRARFADLTYHIYGSGDQLSGLQKQAQTLLVDDMVIFHGSVAYDRLPAILAEADVFVGSGTALIEAAASGLPALVGIESMNDPMTYGFLSEIPGLSYNEMTPDLPLRSMFSCIADVLGDSAVRDSVASACAAKARDFSVERTAHGLIALAEQATATPTLITRSATANMLTGLPLLVARDRLFPETAFAQRRNQSYMLETSCKD